MAKTVRDKFDLDTLTRKVKPFTVNGVIENWIIGCEIGLDDDTYKEVSNYYCDNQTNEIHIDFKDGTDGSFNLAEKFWIKIDSRYLSVPSKKKKRRKRR